MVVADDHSSLGIKSVAIQTLTTLNRKTAQLTSFRKKTNQHIFEIWENTI